LSRQIRVIASPVNPPAIAIPIASPCNNSTTVLNRLKNRYFSYIEGDEISEGTVNIIMLHPLLDLMGLCDLPFRIRGEQSLKIEIVGANEYLVLQWLIDALVVQHQFWIVVIESKE
jgi:hypothetical protein